MQAGMQEAFPEITPKPMWSGTALKIKFLQQTAFLEVNSAAQYI